MLNADYAYIGVYRFKLNRNNFNAIKKLGGFAIDQAIPMKILFGGLSSKYEPQGCHK